MTFFRRVLLTILVTSLALPAGMIYAQTEVPADWITHSGEASSIQAPPSWSDYNALEEGSAELDALTRRYPDLATLLADYELPYEFAAIDLLLYDLKFGTAMSAAAVETTAAEVFTEITSNSIVAGQTLADTVVLENGTKLVFEAAAGTLNTQAHYVLVIEDGVYVLTFTTSADNFTASTENFDLMAGTFSASGTPIANATPSTETTTEVDTSDWASYETEHLTLSAPSGWIDVNDEAALQSAIDTITAQNPDFAATAQLIQQQLASGAINLFLLEPLTGNNINVIVVELGMNLPPATFLPEIENQYALMTGITVVGNEMIQLPAGEALVVELRNEMMPGEAQVQYQYVLSGNNKAYIVTTTASETSAEIYAPIFEAIMNSVELLP